MNIYIFRGKSATGKTALTNMLSEKINVPVLRKDDIFDRLAEYEADITVLNAASYDILAKQIQTCIDNKSDIIVDVALQHTPSLERLRIYTNPNGATRFAKSVRSLTFSAWVRMTAASL